MINVPQEGIDFQRGVGPSHFSLIVAFDKRKFLRPLHRQPLKPFVNFAFWNPKNTSGAVLRVADIPVADGSLFPLETIPPVVEAKPKQFVGNRLFQADIDQVKGVFPIDTLAGFALLDKPKSR